MINSELEQQLLRRRLLGWGLSCEKIQKDLDIGRDLRMEMGQNGLDFAQVDATHFNKDNEDNLGQSLSIALTTALGSDIFNTQFGFDGINALAEETNPVMIRERIRIAIIKLLQKDSRVRRIVDIKLEDGRLDIPTPGSRELDVRVVFEVISGEQASINIGKVIANV
jgi:phage baseplate assembly protein W